MQFSRFEVARRNIPSGRGAMRRGLVVNTALSGAAAMALLGALPARAQDPAPSLTPQAPGHAPPTRTAMRRNDPPPQDLTRLPAGRVMAPPIAAPASGVAITQTPSRAQPVAGHAAPVTDLTIASPRAPLVSGGDVVIEDGDIATIGDNAPGVDTNATGTTTVTVGNVSTQGASSSAIHTYGYGDTTIHAGDIDTRGYRSDGINANTNVGGNSGGIEITAGKVTTSGYASSGIRATAYNGSTSITADSVRTSGYGSDAVYGSSYLHDTNIHVGTVETSGAGGRGITAYSGGTTTVEVDSVTTTGAGTGESFDAGGIKAVGAAVDVRAATVSTSGDYSVGIYANSNFVNDNGQDDRHITVQAGSVTTSGLGSDGIVAINTAKGGATSVTVGSVKTGGDYANGVFAFAPEGDVKVDAGTIETGGLRSNGIIAASYYGNVSVHAGSVTTSGDNAIGVYSYAGGKQFSGGTLNSVDVGSVKTTGDGATGIETISLGQGLDTVIAAGSVETHGYAATGIRAIADGPGSDITIHAGNVSTEGSYSDGIDAINYAIGGKVTVSADKVTTSGDFSAGVFTYAVTGDTNVKVGEVSTSGYLSFGISLGDRYGDVHLDADKVSTTGDVSFGISVSGENVTVNAGTVSTQGELSVGINAGATGNVTVHAGSVTTQDGLARGIDASGANVAVVAGDVSTAGTGANAIAAVAYGSGSVDITTTGHISTTGSYSNAINAYAGGNVAIHNQGVITSAKTGSVGVFALSFHGGDITVDSGGDIATQGLGSKGIWATSYGGGSITVDQGSISTHGDNAHGVYAVSLADGGTDTTPSAITIHADSISTTGYGATGIRTFADAPNTDVTVSAGAITTTGDHAWGVYASTSSGKVSVDVKDVNTSGAGSIGVAARSIYGDVEIKADGVHVASDGGNAIDASSYLGLGNVKVTASNLSAGAYASAIYAGGRSVELNLGGTIDKSGSYSAVGAIAHGGSVTINNDATIRTTNSGPYGSVLANGLYARADGDVTINGSGTITTEGALSYGVVAYSNRGGAITVTQKDISTSGDTSHGVVAVTSNRAGDDPSDGAGGIAVTLDSISTTGTGSSAMLLSDNTRLGSAVAQVTGDITTTGDFAHGVSLYSANQTADAKLHDLSTKGYYAQGVHLNGHRDLLDFDGAISTEGVLSTAIVAYAGNGGIEITGTGSISTKGGYFSSGIRASSPGDVTIAVDGLVSTEGRGSNGIEVTERKRHSEVYPYDPPEGGAADAAGRANDFPIPDPRDEEDPLTGSTISVTAKAVATAGTNAHGIMISTTTGAVDIHSGDVAVAGKGSIGIFAEGRQLSADTGNTSSAQATAIALQGYDSARLAVHGKVQGGTDGVLLQSYDNILTVTAKGSIGGANNGVVVVATPHVTPIVHYWGYAPDGYIGDDEPQPLPPANPGAGAARIDNAGMITAGAGYAITVTGGAIDVENGGVVVGAVRFSSFADTFNNTGRFVATKDSDFGGGGDRFLNGGTLSLARPAGTQAADGAVSVSLLGLERFENSGTVDLRNGAGGDTLTISGAYVGAVGARVGLDVAEGGADKLVIAGAATGSTAIQLGLTPAGAQLLSQPLALVKTGAGSSADAFVLANDVVGFVQYDLRFDTATGSFALGSQAAAPVYRLLKLNEGAQAIWNQAGDAWTSHLAELRDNGERGRGIWGQAYGGVRNHDEQRTIGGTGYALDYRQDFYGGQIGYDMGGRKDGKGRFLFGASTGYLSSTLTLREGGPRIRYDSLNFGGYASYRSGPFFANALAQYVHYWADVSDRGAAWSDKASGNGVGAKLEGGARIGQGRYFIEPIATLAWQNSAFGSLRALGQTIDPHAGTGLTGSLGARVGGTFDLRNGMKAVAYARGDYRHEFAGRGSVSLESGGVSEKVTNQRPGDEGRLALGVNFAGAGPLSGFVEGDATFGQGISGGGGRVGLRFKF